MNVDKYRATANALVRNPDDAEALTDQYVNIAEKLEYSKYYVPLAKRAYEIAPENISAVFNYGSALHRTGEYSKAYALYKKAYALAELHDRSWVAQTVHHCGIAARALGENEKAAAWYQQAYGLTKDPTILRDRALSILASGDLMEGFKAFEIRKEAAKYKAEKNGKLVTQARLPDGVIQWDGESLVGKTVVVYHEEGSGDFIQFCRYIPMLRHQLGVAKIYLTGQVPDLLDLVADHIAVDGIVPLSGPFECDYVIGSMSIPWRIGLTKDRVTGAPYFKTEAAKIPRRGKLNVGLIWRGNPAYGMDHHRSMSFTEYVPLLDMPGIAFYSLQCGPASLEVTNLGFDGFVANLEPLCKTWRDTAKLIQSLDVLVTVDTACAHLAGALGKPVYTLVTNACDWRWNRKSQRTEWYDSMWVIRQKKTDDWAPCIAEVRRHLEGMVNGRRQAA